MIDAGLGDQGIAEARLATLCQYLGPQGTRPLPVPGSGFDERQLRKNFRYLQWKLRIAQKFGKHNWRHDHLPVLERPVEHVHVFAAVSLEKGDPSTRVNRDHRLAFRLASVLEKRSTGQDS